MVVIKGLASMVYRFFDKKSSGSGVDVLLANKSTEPNYQLANELYRQIIKKFKRRKVSSSFRENIWVLILLLCNHQRNTTKESNIYLICFVNMHGLNL